MPPTATTSSSRPLRLAFAAAVLVVGAISALVTAGATGADRSSSQRAGLDRSLDDPHVKRIRAAWRDAPAPKAAEHPPFDEIPQIQQDLDAARARRAERDAQRATPEAKADRLRSRTEYRDHGGKRAAALARARFPGLFSRSDRRLLPLRADQRVVRYTSDTSAVVGSDRRSAGSLVDSTLPLRARDEEGTLRPIDLDLQPLDRGWEPANGPIPLRFGDRADEALSFPGDFTVALFAPESAGSRESNEIFFADVAADTDAWLGPVPTGARVSFQLRSEESPEEVRLSIAEPRIEVRVAAARNGVPAGVELLDGGERVGVMSPPSAFDADGEALELALRVEGRDIVIDVPHRGRDLLYPLAVDPVFENQDSWLYGNGNWAGWRYYESVPQFPHGNHHDCCGYGWWIARNPHQWFSNSWFAEYKYGSPNDYSYIHRADFMHVRHWAWASNTTQGMWSIRYGGFQDHYTSFNQSFDGTGTYFSICADGPASDSSCDESVNVDQSRGNYVQSSISPNADGSWGEWAMMMFGGARIWMSDWEPPGLWYWFDTGSGWMHDTPAGPYNGPNEAHVRYGDRGLGLWGIWMDVPGKSRQQSSDWGNCSGAHSSRCPESRAHNFSYAGISEGTPTVTATGQDVLGRTASASKTLKIDRSAPSALNLGGIGSSSGKWFKDGQYALTLAPQDALSGVRWQHVFTLPQGEDRPEDLKARDSFQRTTVNGLGTADAGGAWQVVDGPAADFRTDQASGEAKVTKTSNVDPLVELPGTNMLDVNAKVRIRIPANSGVANGWLFMRHQAGGGWNTPHVMVGLHRLPTGKIFIVGQEHGFGWSGGPMFSDTDTGLVQSGSEPFYLRVRLIGANPTRVQARAWRPGTPEPDSWKVDKEHTPVEPQRPGRIGFWQWDDAPEPLTIGYGDFAASTWTQKYSLDRGCTTAGQCPRGPQDTGATHNWDTAQYNEGAVDFKVKAADPLGNADQDSTFHSLAQQFTARLDRTPPTIEPSSELSSTTTWFGPGRYELKVDSADSGSGVQRVEFYVDNVLKGSKEPTCSADRCPDSDQAKFTWSPDGTASTRTVKVRTLDLTGNVREQSWTIKVDTVKPTAPVITGTLKGASGKAVKGTAFTLHVEAEDGTAASPSSGVKQIRLLVGPDADTLTERQASLSQPCAQGNCKQTWDTTFTVAAGDESRIPRHIRVQVIDQMGNVSDSAPSDSSRVAQWRLNETSGTTAADSAPPSEQVTNPGFERDTSDWVSGAGHFLGATSTLSRQADGGAPEGAYVAKVVTPAASQSGLGTNVTVTAGRKYRIRVRVKRDAGGSALRIAMGEMAAPNEELVLMPAATPSATGYTDYTGILTPARSGSYRLYVRTTNAVATTFYVDAASVREVNPGTYVGGHTLGQPGATLDGDKAVLLDGSTGRVETRYGVFAGGSVRTFAGWAKRRTDSTTDGLVSGDGTAPPILRTGSGTAAGDIVFAPSYVAAFVTWPGVLPPTGSWFHWALVYDDAARQATLYVNGVSKGTHALPSGYGATPGNLQLGARNGTSVSFDGWIDDIAVYNTALGANDVGQLYRQDTADWKVVFDNGAPTLDAPVHGQPITGWFNGSTSLTVTLTGHDTVSGVKLHKLFTPKQGGGEDVQIRDDASCSNAIASLCPLNPAAQTFTYSTTGMPESAENTVRAVVEDAVGASAQRTWPVRVDRTPPGITLSGPLKEREGQELPPGAYTLNVDARDGDSAGPAAQRRSGVRTTEILLDGERVDFAEQGCPDGSCPMSRSWTFDTERHPRGEHVVEVVSTDQLGHEGRESVRFRTACCAQPPDPWGTAPSFADVGFGDVNGDGADDLIARHRVTGDLSVGLSTGTSFEAAVSWGAWSPLDPLSKPVVGDVTGDGRADLAGQNPVTGEILVAASTGERFASPVPWTTWPTSREVHLRDVDADGDADIAGRDAQTGQVWVGASNRASFDPATVWGVVGADREVAFGDVDRNGLDDLVTRHVETGELQIGFSDGGTFEAPFASGALAPEYEMRLDDVNGDGAADAVGHRPETGEVRVVSSAEDGFGDTNPWGQLAEDSVAHLADASGDGRYDVLGWAESTAVLQALVSEAALPPAPAQEVWNPPPESQYDPEDSVTELREPVMRLGFTEARSLADPEAGKTLDRFVQARGRIVRVTAMWGATEQATYTNEGNKYDWAYLDHAISLVEQKKMFVYLTITGLARTWECPTGSNARACVWGPTGLDPDPAEFAAFARAVAHRYRDRVKWYGIWNEPNHAAWLQDWEPELAPARLYRRLYRAAAEAIRDVDKESRLFIGELSSSLRARSYFDHLPGDPREERLHAVSAADFLREVVRPSNEDDESLDVDAVAWHPYQHTVSPTRPVKKPAPDCGKGVTGGMRSDSGCGRADMGMGELGRIRRLIANLFHEDGISGERWLYRWVDGKDYIPRLYLTEFGYLNIPRGLSDTGKIDKATPRNYWHDEKTRANWFRLALDHALRENARWVLLYHGTELRPPSGDDRTGQPACELRRWGEDTPWDSGLFGCPDVIGGMRAYGKKRGSSNVFENPQRRQAYCAIWDWARLKGYPVDEATGCRQILADAR